MFITVYNAAAAGLRGGRVQAQIVLADQPAAALASVIPDIPVIPVSCDLHDPMVATFAAALQNVAMARGMTLAVLSNAGQMAGRKITTRFSEAAAHNCIFALHPMGSARLQEGLAAGQATRHLLGLGAGPVAFVGGEEFLPIHAQRMRGYNERMTRAELEPLLITGGDDFSFGKRSLAKMLSDYPTYRAALCSNDQVALGMMEGLAERGIKVGDLFRVVGWGDTPPAETLGLSSLRPEIGQLAEVCVDWVLNGGDKVHEIGLTLIRRASSTGGA